MRAPSGSDIVTGMRRDSILIEYVSSRRAPLTTAATTCDSCCNVCRNSPTLAPRGPDNTRPSGKWISTDERGEITEICSFIIFFPYVVARMVFFHPKQSPGNLNRFHGKRRLLRRRGVYAEPVEVLLLATTLGGLDFCQ